MYEGSGLKHHKARLVVKKILSYKHELMLMCNLSLMCFVTLCLVSFDPLDNTFFHFDTSRHHVGNWCGMLGAHVAALLFHLFGSCAYVCIALSVFPAALLVLKRSIFEEYDRLISLLAIFIMLTLVLASHRVDPLGLEPGGLVGQMFFNVLLPSIGRVGIFILGYNVLWCSVIIFMRYSILSVVYTILALFGEVVWQGAVTLYRIGIGAWAIALRGVLSAVSSVSEVGMLMYAGVSKLFRSKEAKKSSSQHKDTSVSPPPKSESSIPAVAASQPAEEDSFWDTFDEKDFSVPSLKEIDDVGLECFEDMSIHTEIYAFDGALFGSVKRLANSVLRHNSIVAFVEASELAAAFGPPRYPEDEPERQMAIDDPPVVEYRLPNVDMFEISPCNQVNRDLLEQECSERALRLEEKLFHFGVKGSVTAVRPGPVITLFEYTPQIDTKISKINALEDDLALALKAMSIRIIAPIPGRSVVGFEIANAARENVYLVDVLQHPVFAESRHALPLVLGVDITGNPVIEDLVTMPHLLVAGSTGSGKSVGLNAMLVSLLCRLSPQELKLILVDPKRLEFAPYKDIPHLLFPIVTNPRKASNILKWVAGEMERRYEVMASAGVRNLLDFKKQRAERMVNSDASASELEDIPLIVIMIDELADLMMVAGKEVELHITRIAQMARAAGIHMIVATQRPSVDVLTGLIKVNFPSRVAYRVSSKIDSKTILDGSGAEKLLGRGDMLYLNTRKAGSERVHGAYVADSEIETLSSYIRSQQKVSYLDITEALSAATSRDESQEDELYGEVIAFLESADEISISMLQRKFRIGFNRSARLIEQLEHSGLIAPAQGSKPRKILRQ